MKELPKEFPFPENPGAVNYLFFPDELEENELNLFHATPLKNLSSILEHGFKIPDPASGNPLTSVSFAKMSILAFNHAMSGRNKISPMEDWCIIVVEYDSLDRPSIVNNNPDIHDYKMQPQPRIIGYCIIPNVFINK